MRLSHGSVYFAGFRRPGHDVLHYQSDVRRIQGETICFSAVAEAHGDGGLVRKKERQGFLRLVEPGKARPAGCRAARLTQGVAGDEAKKQGYEGLLWTVAVTPLRLG